MSYAAVVTRTRLKPRRKPGLPTSNYDQPVIHFLKTLNKILTQNKCDQLLERLLQLESKTRSQKEIILKNIDETKKINELLEEKQIQLEALLLIFAATVVVAAMLLKIILVFKL